MSTSPPRTISCYNYLNELSLKEYFLYNFLFFSCPFKSFPAGFDKSHGWILVLRPLYPSVVRFNSSVFQAMQYAPCPYQ